jgi:hypothetical protein
MTCFDFCFTGPLWRYMPIATVDQSAMSLNDNGAAYYRVLDLLSASCRGLFQPGCPWLDRRYLHETSKDVFCVAPPVDVRRFLQVPYHPVRLSISPRADFVDRVAVETVSLLHNTKDDVPHHQCRMICDRFPHRHIIRPHARFQRVPGGPILHRPSSHQHRLYHGIPHHPEFYLFP